MTKQTTPAASSPPDWAPDGCPPKVIQLVDDEQWLADMGLRGLASADSQELHQAVRRLKQQLGGAFAAGKAAGRFNELWPRRRANAWLWATGFAAGVLVGALGVIWLAIT